MLQFKSLISTFVLYYLRFFARLQLKKNPRAVVIGITGSVGKTSTRLALAQILRSKGIVKHSVNANSESGIPLNILGIKLRDYSPFSWLKALVLAPYQYLTFVEHYDYYVVEMGIDSPYPPKNMDYLLSIIRPDAAIILGAALVHSEAFDPLVRDTSPSARSTKIIDLIAREKMKLAQSIKKAGVVILNADNPPIQKYKKSVRARLITVGKRSGAQLKIQKTTLSRRGLSVDISYQQQKYTLVINQPLGVEYDLILGSAIAMASALGLPVSQSIMALSSYIPPAGRMRYFEGIRHTHIIDSSYNASPVSMVSALTTLKKMAGRANKIAILGDMRELGQSSKIAHQQLGRIIPEYVNQVILFGPATKQYILPQLERIRFPVFHAATMVELVDYLKKNLKQGSWILVKGSQNTIMLERAVEAILNNQQDLIRLARRGQYWDKVRNNTL